MFPYLVYFLIKILGKSFHHLFFLNLFCSYIQNYLLNILHCFHCLRKFPWYSLSILFWCKEIILFLRWPGKLSEVISTVFELLSTFKHQTEHFSNTSFFVFPVGFYKFSPVAITFDFCVNCLCNICFPIPFYVFSWYIHLCTPSLLIARANVYTIVLNLCFLNQLTMTYIGGEKEMK